MKKLFNIYLYIIASVILFSGCEDFLDTRPQGSLDEVSFQNEEGIELLVTSVYAALAPGRHLGDSYTNWISGSVSGGEANKGSAANDQPGIMSYVLYNLTSSNAFVEGKWGDLYDLIARANSTLKTIKGASDLSEDFVNPKTGELKFLRAYGYFELRRAFKNVPYVDDSYEENDPKLYNNEDIYPYIINDLEDAMDKLPEVSGSGRANYWAAKALLAKVYIYQSNFTIAEPLLKDIIDNGVTSTGTALKLMDNFSEVYSITLESDNSEALFSINHASDGEGLYYNSGWAFCWPLGLFYPFSGFGFYQPSYDLVNSYQVNSEGLPFLDNSYRSIPSVTNVSAGVATSDLTIAVDPRLDWTIARPDLPVKDYGMWEARYIRDIVYGGPFFINKMLHWSTETEGAALLANLMNYHVIRLADIILMYAECLAENGNPTEARQYVNMIRERAANQNVTLDSGDDAAIYSIANYPESQFQTKDDALLAIRFERKLELALEGHRFYDLARWGSAYAKQELDALTAYEGTKIDHYNSALPFDENRVYYPIPLTEIQTVGKDENGQNYLQQNDGY